MEAWRQRCETQLRDLRSMVESGLVSEESKWFELNLTWPFEDRARRILDSDDKLSTKSPLGNGASLFRVKESTGGPVSLVVEIRWTRSIAPSWKAMSRFWSWPPSMNVSAVIFRVRSGCSRSEMAPSNATEGEEVDDLAIPKE